MMPCIASYQADCCTANGFGASQVDRCGELGEKPNYRKLWAKGKIKGV